MNRKDFKKLSRMRLKETEALLRTGNYSGAYYLCGYIIECALKACIARKTRRYEFPDKEKVNNSYTHNLEKLIKVAELEFELNEETKRNKNFNVN